MKTYDEQTVCNWLGEGAEPEAAQLAISTLDDCFRRGYGKPLGRTPGMTGALAWKRTSGQGWEPLPVEQQALLQDTTGQGRFEACPVVETLPGLVCLDLRLAYAASAISIKGGRAWRYEKRPAGGWAETGQKWCLPGFRDYDPARYLVRFRVPGDWSHVGILPAHGKGGWKWPSAPGEEAEDWADSREISLAVDCGWQVEIIERFICEPEGKYYAQPLRAWAERLLRIRERLMEGAGEETRPLYKRAIRNVILQSIGIFAVRPKVETRQVGSREDLSEHELAEETYRELPDGTIEFEDYAASPRVAPLLHREFAAAVWADTRVRLLKQNAAIGGAKVTTGALLLPREQVVGFGLDCVYTTHNPSWPDDDREGRFRVKEYLPGPLPAPRNRVELEHPEKLVERGAAAA